jgi:hypothetical protein
MEDKPLSLKLEKKTLLALKLQAIRSGKSIRQIIEDALLNYIEDYNLEEAGIFKKS